MTDPDRIPKESLAEIVRRVREGRRRRVPENRPSVHDSIQNDRTTLIINLVIEAVSGLILLTGIGFTAKFMIDHADRLAPGQLQLYLSVLMFFTAGWFTYIGFRVRAKYRALKRRK